MQLKVPKPLRRGQGAARVSQCPHQTLVSISSRHFATLSPSHPAQSRDFACYSWFSYAEDNLQSCFSVLLWRTPSLNSWPPRDSPASNGIVDSPACQDLTAFEVSEAAGHPHSHYFLFFFSANTVRWTLGNDNFCLRVWTELKSPRGSAPEVAAQRSRASFFHVCRLLWVVWLWNMSWEKKKQPWMNVTTWE